jgi:Fur family ferric uptake transcriptional regulator
MDNLKDTLLQLKNRGYRFSAVRNVILTSLDNNKRPLSVFDLQKLLKAEKLIVNKTTVYRELNSLKKEGIVLEIQLKGNKRWYELSARDHHHHIICVKCDKVEDFEGCDSENLVNKALKQAPNFAQITNHTVDFFGLCKSCAKK